MGKTYIKPVTNVYSVQLNDLVACSMCDHPGNHYGHHKDNGHNKHYEEEEVSTNFIWNE